MNFHDLMTTENPIETRQLGSTGLKVLPMALACMGMSGMYGAANDLCQSRKLTEPRKALKEKPAA
jgi:aryl-alcohol dehydrogenase-like predicted oxidoreductase